MHLLKLDDDSKPVLTRFLASNIPSYAILSHTWEADDQEVTFKDLTDGVGVNKLGYGKIRFCGERALEDGLQYFWVDSCCIDKSSSAELQEAINSMFRWYRNAAKCYVYLTDVSTGKHSRSSQPLWHSAFGQSRWFTRGWTLQELLAPSSVEFFSREGKRLGDKKSLEVEIQHITGIPVQALQGNTLSKFNVDERMSWAIKRNTTIEEDQAYCLLGIFNIYLPLIYGEGKENAFCRLQKEIRGFSDDSLILLPYAAESAFNSNDRQHDPTCLPDTRVDLLRDIYNWADGQDGRCIFWLNGLAGTGKSAIARTIARRYFDQKCLGASFFSSRGGGDVGHAGKFVTSIARQLANNIPTLQQHICDTIKEYRDITSQSLHDQWQQLVLRPLSKLDGNGSQSSNVLVVDALDECDNDNNIRIIIRLLAEAGSLKTVRLRVFLTSRPEVPIRNGFTQMPDTEHLGFVLHNISPSIVDNDIFIFFEYNLKLIGQEHDLDACWPGEEVIRQLIQIAGGLFIWAATACRYIQEGLFADERVQTLLEGSTSTTAPEEHLNKLYTTVLKKSIRPGYSTKEKEALYGMLRHIVGSIVVLFSPLSASSLHKLLGITKQKIDEVLKDLHTILDIPKVDDYPLRLHHPSFRDFLLSSKRCEDANFWVDEKQAHQVLVDSCIQLMSTSLRQDVCSIGAPSMLVADIESSRVAQSLSPEVQYACRYWIEHVQRSGTPLRDNGQVHVFLREHLLH